MSANSHLPEAGVHGKFEADFGAEQDRSVDHGEEDVAARRLCAHFTGKFVAINLPFKRK